MAAQKPLVYLILGTSGAGRREVMADLIEGAFDESERTVVLLADDEAADEADARLPAITRWSWRDDTIAAELPHEATRVFFVASGRRNPVEQIEVFKAWLEAQGGELARVLCVVDCRLASKHPELLPWFEACVHFADVVLLNRREGVENKWVSGFLGHFEKLHYPCLFEMVKAGRLRNPALVLEPQARRMTHVFDEEQEWIFTDSSGEQIDEQEESEGEEEVVASLEEEPYFVRDAAGRRLKKVPDIAKFL